MLQIKSLGQTRTERAVVTQTLTDSWDVSADLGKHDLWVYGPTGFVRVFKDDAQVITNVASPECRVCYDIANGDVYVKFSNTGAQASTLTIQDNAYGSGGSLVVKVEPGKVVEQYWTLRKSGNWYDFSVTADTSKGYLRRFAGRVETGQHGLATRRWGLRKTSVDARDKHSGMLLWRRSSFDPDAGIPLTSASAL